MILSDKEILKRIEKGDILLSPFKLENLGSNSYDLHLSPHLAIYGENKDGHYLDAKLSNWINRFEITQSGFILKPNKLYLGSTIEYTESHHLVPFIDGKSSVGRLGVNVHITAGKGDIGFCGYWTLEITVVEPVKFCRTI